VHLMSITTSHENRWGYAVSLLFAVIAGGHWVVSLCYSRGYDFFLWLYNAWLMNKGIANGDWSDWSSFSASGQPAFKMAGVLDALVMGLFTSALGLEVGARFYAVLLYVIAGMGMYVLARDLSESAMGGIVASVSYSLSWFLSFTAYYQSYLSNLLLYALMPWCALFFIYAICRASRGYLLASALILCISVTSNAQVAVKVVLFVVPLAYVVAVHTKSASLRRWLVYSILFGLFAAWWSIFLIAPAMVMRQEVLLLGEARGNAFIAPWLVLFWIPLYGLNFVCYWVTGLSFLGRDFLAWAVFSDYIGLSTLGVAIASVGFYVKARDRRVAGLWALLGGYYLIYFAAIPNMAASAWVGRTHNWAILPTLALSLLAAFGMRHIASLVLHWLKPIAAVGMVCVLLLVDLGGVTFFLNRLAITHLSLEDLPEVGVWKQLQADDADWDEGHRFFTYNPDHTFYLLPVLMQKPVANIIELRTRNWEYDSYISHQLQAMRTLDSTYNTAESLALLDVEYVDLARKLYDYRGDGFGFERGVTHLQADPNLELLIEREETSADNSYDASSRDLSLGTIVNGGGGQAKQSQAVFRNLRHFWGVVPEETILVLGSTRKGQEFFEKITHLPEYRADRLLFILSESWGELDVEMRSKFAACIAVGDAQAPAEIEAWDMDQLRAFYAREVDSQVANLTRLEKGAERTLYEIDRNVNGNFIFLSQQYFRDWHAYNDRREIPVLKAQAGLTALYLPAGVRLVEHRYVLPAYEWYARAFSVLGLFVAFMWWALTQRQSSAVASPHFAEQKRHGSSANYGKTTELVGR